ncbi:tRNA uracil 4-sulfurtransferase ThiI [uncultured Dubosiella sp.]|uniref:tRNA uracil 4-sulfurtransferase ThiI n=1 Tax=uncultured Dubosiella sp. TaxID=1937011 RepID=UPI0025927506|nr:tRNA uracil 4-sulfurtransferase ThiI [uncultured Dubosiella sp.]
MAYRYDHILIRYGELSLKGKNRNSFIKQLLANVKLALKAYPGLEFEKQHDRMYIYLHDENPEAVSETLAKVFGISSFSLAVKTEPDMDAIVQACMESLNLSEKKTFKVAARRSDKNFPVISDQINRIVATAILKNSDWKVDVRTPDVKIVVEVHSDAAYIMTDKIPGAGGYPVGVGGKAMVLLSGGIDSPVASYLMMKRGVHIECVHFAAPPYTSQNAQDKVMALAELISPYQGEILVHVVPFTDLQLAIYQNADESYAITLMRRMMMRIATKLAQKRHCQAIATGESIGQVASQTLESMQAINAVTTMPLIRPVVCMDKVEIIDISKKINTYETSILPFEDCCTIFTPKNPVTKPRIEKCERYESRFDWEKMVDWCVDDVKSYWIHPGVSNEEEQDEDLF